MIGKRYSRLVVLEKAPDAIYSYGKFPRFLCQCDCGKQTIAFFSNLERGATKSCGCWKKESANQHRLKHRMSSTSEYKIWLGIKKRCLNKNYREYHLYGGRGIGMDQSWIDSFQQFFLDMGERPSDNHSIDRINNDLGYTKDNCRWATKIEQGFNTRKTHKVFFMGKQTSVRQFAFQINHSYNTVYDWIVRRNMSVEDVLKKISYQSET